MKTDSQKRKIILTFDLEFWWNNPLLEPYLPKDKKTLIDIKRTCDAILGEKVQKAGAVLKLQKLISEYNTPYLKVGDKVRVKQGESTVELAWISSGMNKFVGIETYITEINECLFNTATIRIHCDKREWEWLPEWLERI